MDFVPFAAIKYMSGCKETGFLANRITLPFESLDRLNHPLETKDKLRSYIIFESKKEITNFAYNFKKEPVPLPILISKSQIRESQSSLESP